MFILGRNFFVVSRRKRSFNIETMFAKVIVRIDLADACVNHSPVKENKGE